jgi:hypothetical protein
MQFRNIVFYNHWHYGDLFSTRGLVTDIKNQLPHLSFHYLHMKNADATRDLCPNVHEEFQNVLDRLPQHARYADASDTLFINTWVGAYMGMWPNTHPSYISHRLIYQQLYKELADKYDIRLQLSDVWHYVPDIDYRTYNTRAADGFLISHAGNRYLFCNGAVQSTQSSMGDMQELIHILAAEYPDDLFIVTEKFATHLDNVVFTSDIFHQSCDICEISYLSSKCDLIVGKNSGPFTYASTKANLSDKSKMFLCLSHRPEDVLPYGLDLPCDFRFSHITNTQQLADQLGKTLIPAIKTGNLTPGFHHA